MAQVEIDSMVNPMTEHEAAAMVLAGIARAVVQSPENVRVQTLPEVDGALLTLQVDSMDYDTVIGSGGRTVRSLRTVLTALGKRSGQRFTLDVQSNTL